MHATLISLSLKVKKILRYSGETNGLPTLYCLIETLIPRGVAILMRKGTDRTIQYKILDDQGRCIVTVDIANHNIP